MAIELISKIKPKNNGNFKLVDAQDVEYNGKGLDEAIASGEFKGDKGDRGDIGPIGPTGPTGPKGDNGNDGFSPTVSVAEEVDGVTVTVQNKDGAQTAKVKNGKDGKDYEHSEEFSALAEQVRADKEAVEQSKTSVEQTVAQAEGKIDAAGTIAIQGVQNEGTTQTEKVTVEGTKQITEIQSKGEEILHSFPQDFPTQMATKLDKQQGTEHVGKVIAVNEEGNATPLCPNGVRYNPETNNLEYGSDDLPLMEGIKLDDSLTKEGFAADAKVVGDRFDSKLNKQQGVENAGKAVVVGEDGNLVVGDVQTGGGISDCADAIVNTASGVSPLVIADSSDRVIKDLKLFGKTEQVQTTGAQLFDASGLDGVTKSGITISVKDGIITATGTTENDIWIESYVPAEEYKKLFKPGEKIYIKTQKSSDCNYDFGIYGSFGSPILGSVKESSGGATLPTELPRTDTSFYFFMDIKKGSALKGSIKPIVYHNGNGTWEPYTGGKPSPSPEYPQDIVNAGKLNEDTGKYEVGVKVFAGNLFDSSNNKKGFFTGAVGSQISLITSQGYSWESKINMLSGVRVTLSAHANVNTRIALYATDINGMILYKYNDYGANSADNYHTFVIPDKAESLLVSVMEISDSKGAEIILNVGENRLLNAIYKEPQTLTLTSDRPITKWDRLVEQGGEIGWLINSKIIDNFDGQSNRIEIANKKGDVQHFAILFDNTPNGNGSADIYVDKYRAVNVSYTKAEYGICCNWNDTKKFFSAPNESITTVDEFKAWLSKNPLKIAYQTASTEFIPLPQEEQDAIRALSTYYPTTVIVTDGGELDPDVEVTYTADTKNYIDNKFAQLQKSLVNTQVQLL